MTWEKYIVASYPSITATSLKPYSLSSSPSSVNLLKTSQSGSMVDLAAALLVDGYRRTAFGLGSLVLYNLLSIHTRG